MACFKILNLMMHWNSRYTCKRKLLSFSLGASSSLVSLVLPPFLLLPKPFPCCCCPSNTFRESLRQRRNGLNYCFWVRRTHWVHFRCSQEVGAYDYARVEIDWFELRSTFHSTQNRSFRRRFSQLPLNAVLKKLNLTQIRPHHVPKYGKHPISDRWD